MVEAGLYDFIAANRDELIRRCKTKAATRSGAPPSGLKSFDHGVPMFLDQLVLELRHGLDNTALITMSAVKHGRDLLDQGFTVSQVVHDYGDVCQSITDLAVELESPISTTDFRTLNRCLDDAIAGAVTEHAHVLEVTRDGQADELVRLVHTAIAAYEVLQTGTVGIQGTTGALVYSNLVSIRALIDRRHSEAGSPSPDTDSPPAPRT